MAVMSIMDKKAFGESIKLVIGGAMGALAYDGIQRVMQPASSPIESVALAAGGVGWTLLLIFLTAYLLWAYPDETGEGTRQKKST